MSPLQVRILRALDAPMTTGQIGTAVGVMGLDMLAALHGIGVEGWATGETVGRHLLWSRTPAGTEALAAVTALPIDSADERAAAAFEESA